MASRADDRADGRVLRGERNRRAVVDAFLGLVCDGDLRPTAQRIADRAGVSLRSVFHHFEDMEGLIAEAADAHFDDMRRLMGPLAAVGPLPQRIRAFVAQRARLAEAVLPVFRAASLVEHRSAEVARRAALGNQVLRAELAHVFAAELERAANRADLIDALDAAASLEHWSRLRHRQKLTPARSRKVMSRTVSALLVPSG